MILLLSDSEIAMDLAQRIKKERIAQSIKQTDLALRADISLSVVKNFEQSGKITLKNLISILKALGKSSLFTELFDFEKERIENDAFEYAENQKNKYNRKRVK